MRRTPLFAVVLVTTLATAQNPAADTPPTPAQVELAEAVRALDAALEQVAAARAHADRAVQRAQLAEAHARQHGQEPITVAAAGLQEQVVGFRAAVDGHVEVLRDLRARAIAELSAEQLGPLVPLRDKVLAAHRLPTLEDAEAELCRVHDQLAAEGVREQPGAARLRSFVSYCLGDILRQRAAFEIQRRADDKEAAKLLRRASQTFAEVLAGPDSADSGEGSSLHAAALRRIVQVEGALYVGHRQLRGQANSKAARQHREAAQQAFERLGRVHADAVLPDGTSFVTAARDDIAQFAR